MKKDTKNTAPTTTPSTPSTVHLHADGTGNLHIDVVPRGEKEGIYVRYSRPEERLQGPRFTDGNPESSLLRLTTAKPNSVDNLIFALLYYRAHKFPDAVPSRYAPDQLRDDVLAAAGQVVDTFNGLDPRKSVGPQSDSLYDRLSTLVDAVEARREEAAEIREKLEEQEAAELFEKAEETPAEDPTKKDKSSDCETCSAVEFCSNPSAQAVVAARKGKPEVQKTSGKPGKSYQLSRLGLLAALATLPELSKDAPYTSEALRKILEAPYKSSEQAQTE
jgi:hypothetical protein